MSDKDIREYTRSDCISFRKTNEPFGGLSNMAPGFPICINGISVRSSEAIYQACRFPHRPELQRLILDQRSPMTAKMKTKKHRDDSRPDWFDVRVTVMRWALRVKLAQNWTKFSQLLLSTGDFPIVEDSRKDEFWGAKPMKEDNEKLIGYNVLGRLLMELRQELRSKKADQLRTVPPPTIDNFLLMDEPIRVVSGDQPIGTSARELQKRISWSGDVLPNHLALFLDKVLGQFDPDDQVKLTIRFEATVDNDLANRRRSQIVAILNRLNLPNDVNVDSPM